MTRCKKKKFLYLRDTTLHRRIELKIKIKLSSIPNLSFPLSIKWSIYLLKIGFSFVLKFFIIRATWDLLIGFFVLYSSFFSPLNIAFRFRFDETGKLFYDIGENITLAFFIFDILVNLRTTFYTSNNEEVIYIILLKLIWIKFNINSVLSKKW